ncbi:MAG TPA: Ig-like domain-containing protein, partial [Rugosimonospora sp.]|nr:Ig-like domain-containing protein [Rugosimonospora sp.]
MVNQLAGALPSVLVLDANDAPVPGVTVTFAVTSGGGSVTGATQQTDANGIATVGGWRMGQTAGANGLSASVTGLTPLTFTATAGPTAVATLAKISGDGQSANAGSALAQPLVIEVRDTFNNPVPQATVTWSVTDGSITPGSGPSDAQGRAQASWTLGVLQASPTATAAVGAVQTSFTATAIPQTPTVQLAFAGVPGIGIGLSTTVNVTLNQPVPSGTLAVALASSNTGVFTIAAPDTVYIPQGQTSGTKVLNGIAAGTATLTGTAPGYTSGTLTVVVQNRNISLPSTLNVPYGQTASLPITLPAQAPAGGVTFTVTSSDPSLVGVVTSTVTIAAGSQTGNATLSGVLPGPATVTVSNPAYVPATSSVTTRAALDIVQTTSNPNVSFPTTITINFVSNGTPQAAPAPGIPVTLTPLDPTCAAATSPVTIPTGQVSASSQLSYGGSAQLPCTTPVVATAANLQSDTVSVTVSPQPAITLNLPTTQLGRGLEEQASFSLGATNHGGTTVTITSGDPAVLLLTTVSGGTGAPSITLNVLPGVGSATFYYQALEGASGSVGMTATATGFTNGVATTTIVQPGIELVSVPTSTTTLSPNSAFYAQVGLPNGQLTALQRVQNLRGNAPGPLTVTVTSASPAVGTIVDSVNGPAGGATGTARIPSGRYYTGTSGPASGGVAFRPLSTGTSAIS